MNTRVGALVVFASLAVAWGGCGFETRNREVISGELDGTIAERRVSRAGVTHLVDMRAEDGFAFATLDQHGPDGNAELTLLFDRGIDAIIDEAEGSRGSIEVTARAETEPWVWGPDFEGAVLSVESTLSSTESISNSRVRGTREHWDLVLHVDFDPARDGAPLVVEGPDETVDVELPEDDTSGGVPAEAEVEVRLHYDRDRVRDVPRESNRTPRDFDDDC